MFNVTRNDSQVTVDSITKESYISPGAQWAVLSLHKPEFFTINKTTGAVHNMPSAEQTLSSINLELQSSAVNDERKETMLAALQATSEATAIAISVLSIQAAYEDAATQASSAFAREQLIKGLTNQQTNIQITQTRVKAINPKSYISWMFGSSTPQKSSAISRETISFDENSDTISIPAHLMESIIKLNDYKQKSDVTLAANLLFKQCFIAQQQHRGDFIAINPRNPLSAENYIYNNFPNIYVKYNNTYPICEKVQALGLNARVPLLHIRQAIQTALSIANQKSASNLGSFLPQYLTSYLDGVVSELMKYDNHMSELCKNPAYGATPTDIAQSTQWSTMSKVAAGLAVVGTLAAAYYFQNEIGEAGQKTYNQAAETTNWLTGKTVQLEKDKAAAEKLAVEKAAADQKVVDDQKAIAARIVQEKEAARIAQEKEAERIAAKNETDRNDENARRSEQAKLAEKKELSAEQEKAIQEFVENPVTFTEENIVPLVKAVGIPAAESIKENAPIVAKAIKENTAPVIKSIKENAPIVAEIIKDNAIFAKDVAVGLSTNTKQGPEQKQETVMQQKIIITPAPIKTKEQILKEKALATAESLKQSASNAKEKLAEFVGYETEKMKNEKEAKQSALSPQEKAAASKEADKPKRIFGATGLAMSIEPGMEEFTQESQKSTDQAAIDAEKMRQEYSLLKTGAALIGKDYQSQAKKAASELETTKVKTLETTIDADSVQEKLNIAAKEKNDLENKINQNKNKLDRLKKLAEAKNSGRGMLDFTSKSPEEDKEIAKLFYETEALNYKQQFAERTANELKIQADAKIKAVEQAKEALEEAKKNEYEKRRLAIIAADVEKKIKKEKETEKEKKIKEAKKEVEKQDEKLQAAQRQEIIDTGIKKIQKTLNPMNIEYTGKGLNAYNQEMENENDVSYVSQLEDYDIAMDQYNPYDYFATKPKYPMNPNELTAQQKIEAKKDKERAQQASFFNSIYNSVTGTNPTDGKSVMTPAISTNQKADDAQQSHDDYGLDYN